MSRLLRTAFLAAAFLFLGAPLVIVAGVSVNAKKRLLFPPEGFSLGWYREMLTDAAWLKPIGNSLVIATLGALVALSIALPLAYALWRRRILYARALYALGIAPFILPPVISALGFLIFWSWTGHGGRIENDILSHGVFLVTLPLVTVSLGLESIDRAVVEAAATLGADHRTALRTVVLPLIVPYILSGYAFAFVLSMNEYIIAYMVAGFTVETLPIKIFNSLRYGYTPVMAAVAVGFVALAALVFGLIGRFGDLPRLLGAWAPEKR
ncbi:MAG TPA: ABC transporter permease [Dongiaceae bacterium]|nr:ABC transporter permease [Dongiaceae bacterium]